MEELKIYKEIVNPAWYNFTKSVLIGPKTIAKLDKATFEIAKIKKKEYLNRKDPGQEEKRWYTARLGELAVDKILGSNIVDWTIGESKSYNYGDLKSFGFNIGVKTSCYGACPLVPINPHRPELILIRMSYNLVTLCGIASIENMKNLSHISLVRSKYLRDKNVKHGYYGYDVLTPINSRLDLENFENGKWRISC